MRIPQRPALPVVFLLALGALQSETSLEELSQEIARWRRIQAPLNAEAEESFEKAFRDVSARWVKQWPSEELAWRQRLRALESGDFSPKAAAEALAGAERALGGRPGLSFPEDTRFLMARTAVRHGVRTADVEGWLREAVALVENELPRGRQAIVHAYRRERLSEARWRAALVRADLAYKREDRNRLRAQIASLAAQSVVAVHDPADRIAVAERARRRAALLLWHARLARLDEDRERAVRLYTKALAARPATPGTPEPPENAELIREAAEYASLDPGAGARVPPADKAGPHWLPTEQRLDGAQPGGRPTVIAIWDGEDARQARALERLERRGEARVISRVAPPTDWVERVNPLYTAPQIWIADQRAIVRLVGRFQPGGDGWEDAVMGAALRTAAR